MVVVAGSEAQAQLAPVCQQPDPQWCIINNRDSSSTRLLLNSSRDSAARWQVAAVLEVPLQLAWQWVRVQLLLTRPWEESWEAAVDISRSLKTSLAMRSLNNRWEHQCSNTTSSRWWLNRIRFLRILAWTSTTTYFNASRRIPPTSAFARWTWTCWLNARRTMPTFSGPCEIIQGLPKILLIMLTCNID